MNWTGLNSMYVMIYIFPWSPERWWTYGV